MLIVKITESFFDSRNLGCLMIVCNIFCFFGLLLIIAFPIMSENTYIRDMQLKNTVLHNRDIDKNFFIQSFKEYLFALNNNSLNHTNEILQFCQGVLNNKNTPYNQIYTNLFK